MAISRTLTMEQPHGTYSGLLDEGQQDLGRDRDAGLVVVPRPRRQTEAAGQLRSAALAKELLADFLQAPS
jgi:hypothetical protein